MSNFQHETSPIVCFQAAFIAGVQSQIISFTMNLPQSSMGKATNSIAFVGLLLDVIGTFLGVIHAIVLQRRIKENTSLLNAMTQIIREPQSGSGHER
jgi:zinc transporter ZupT